MVNEIRKLVSVCTYLAISDTVPLALFIFIVSHICGAKWTTHHSSPTHSVDIRRPNQQHRMTLLNTQSYCFPELAVGGRTLLQICVFVLSRFYLLLARSFFGRSAAIFHLGRVTNLCPFALSFPCLFESAVDIRNITGAGAAAFYSIYTELRLFLWPVGGLPNPKFYVSTSSDSPTV